MKKYVMLVIMLMSIITVGCDDFVSGNFIDNCNEGGSCISYGCSEYSFPIYIGEPVSEYGFTSDELQQQGYVGMYRDDGSCE